MNANHEELEKGINEAVLVLGPLAYEPAKLTSAEAWALGVLTGTALRLLALLRGSELPKRGEGECCFHNMDIGGNRMDCPAKHREDNAEVMYLRKLLNDVADKFHAAIDRCTKADEAEKEYACAIAFLQGKLRGVESRLEETLKEIEKLRAEKISGR